MTPRVAWTRYKQQEILEEVRRDHAERIAARKPEAADRARSARRRGAPSPPPSTSQIRRKDAHRE